MKTLVMCGQHCAGRWKKGLGLGLIVLSFLFYGGLAVMPFALLPTREKVIISSILVVCGEASFLIAVLILGRDAISKYRKLDIHDWFYRRKKTVNLNSQGKEDLESMKKMS